MVKRQITISAPSPAASEPIVCDVTLLRAGGPAPAGGSVAERSTAADTCCNEKETQ